MCAHWHDVSLVGDQARPKRKLVWIAPSPLLQSSFSVISNELLQRLKSYDILYLGQNYMGEPRTMGNYTLASYSTGEHILHYMDIFKPDVTVLFQSPPYLQRFTPMTKLITEKSLMVIYTPVESTPLGIDVNQLFNEAELLLVPSKWSQACLRAHGIESEVLYHAVDTSIFKPSSKPAQFTIGSIASHVWRKQLTRILDAHRLAENKGCAIRCLMIASTYDVASWMPDLSGYRKQINSDAFLNETAYLNLPVNQREIAKLYDEMHCHVLTATEAFGMPNLEAMASGVVPIIINHGASPEVVGDCGIYARVSDYLDLIIGKVALVDVQDLAEKMIWASQHPEELKRLAAKGIDRAKLFNWNDVTSRLEELLGEICI